MVSEKVKILDTGMKSSSKASDTAENFFQQNEYPTIIK